MKCTVALEGRGYPQRRKSDWKHTELLPIVIASFFIPVLSFSPSSTFHKFLSLQLLYLHFPNFFSFFTFPSSNTCLLLFPSLFHSPSISFSASRYLSLTFPRSSFSSPFRLPIPVLSPSYFTCLFFPSVHHSFPLTFSTSHLVSITFSRSSFSSPLRLPIPILSSPYLTCLFLFPLVLH